MSKVVAIRIRSADPLTYTDSNGLDRRPNKYVVVQGEKGPELGQVIRNPQDVVYAQTEDKMLPTVLRVATGSDLGNLQRNQELEREGVCVRPFQSQGPWPCHEDRGGPVHLRPNQVDG